MQGAGTGRGEEMYKRWSVLLFLYDTHHLVALKENIEARWD